MFIRLQAQHSFHSVPLPLVCDTEDKVDDDGGQQGKSQHRGTEAVVEAALTALADALRAPVKGDEGVDHGRHGDEREKASADLTNLIAKVEQADGQTAEDDGEVEP